jgi:hypothetical protein
VFNFPIFKRQDLNGFLVFVNGYLRKNLAHIVYACAVVGRDKYSLDILLSAFAAHMINFQAVSP